MARNRRKIRVYPTCCTSAFCGSGPDKCPTCPNQPTLQAFKQWVADNNAVVSDPIWSPLVYEARPELALQLACREAIEANPTIHPAEEQ